MEFDMSGLYGSGTNLAKNPVKQLSNLSASNSSGYTPITDEMQSYANNFDPASLNVDTNAGGGVMDWLGKNKDGFAVGGAILQGAGSLWSAWNGFQQNKQAEKQFAFEKQAYNTNLANQAQTINTQLEDRQRARIGGTGDGNASGNYESLNTYMANNKVDGTALA